jgi:3-methyladenine DNA glycosylase AlkD
MTLTVKAGVTSRTSPRRAAADARRALARMARPAAEFDASRYFRAAGSLGFYNVGTRELRGLAHQIYTAHRDDWSIGDAVEFAGALIKDRHLDVKSIAIEVLARHRRHFTPRLLRIWKRWLADGHSSNWATTDAICGYLVGPLVMEYPAHLAEIVGWAGHRNMWVRRAAAVGLVRPAREGAALDEAYEVARLLHGDREDLIQKAVGWLLREAGKADEARLERYLRRNGPGIPRTTVRYAVERFSEPKRRELLRITYGR